MFVPCDILKVRSTVWRSVYCDNGGERVGMQAGPIQTTNWQYNIAYIHNWAEKVDSNSKAPDLRCGLACLKSFLLAIDSLLSPSS